MMNTDLLSERSCLPTLHSCGYDRDMINATTFDGGVSADFFVTLSPEQLTASPNVFDVGKAVVVLPRSFSEGRPSDTKLRVFSELAQEELEVLRLNRHVSIKIANHLRAHILRPDVASVERMHFPSEVPLGTFRHPK